MTAEVAILNKRGIALAADSAVTVSVEGGVKIFPSANKLFTLSKYEPVGVMIYSSAEMLGVPWETAIKVYRKEISGNTQPHLAQYATDFLRFIQAHDGLYPQSQKDSFGEQEITALFTGLRDTFYEEFQLVLTGQHKMDVDDPDLQVKELLTAIFEANHRKAKTMPVFEREDGSAWPNELIEQIEKRYASKIPHIREAVFSGIPLDGRHKRLLLELGKLSLSRAVGATGYTGIVIAGYGTGDFFPSVTAFEVYGNLDGNLRYVRNQSKQASIDSGNDAAIVAFAQSEMVMTFMEGVDPSYQATVRQALVVALETASDAFLEIGAPGDTADEREKTKNAVVSRVLKALDDTLDAERWKHFIGPILRIVAALPKTELASMAESLVNLTSMKRHVSSVSETVGGPIDVALISKGDGFVWIKRKHYFDKDLNYHFFANYFKEGGPHEE